MRNSVAFRLEGVPLSRHRRLNPNDTKVTEAGLQDLEKAQPDCVIQR
jgi:hypothetical protein